MTEWLKNKCIHLVELLRTRLKSDTSRTTALMVAGLVGMVLLCLSEWLPSAFAPDTTTAVLPDSCAQSDSQTYAAELEQRLQDMIETVEGAGHCRVMVTLAAGEETIYATDTEQGETSSRTEHVLLGDAPLVESIQAPVIQGVAITCEGGDNAKVRNTVTELVRALTGIGANHITVTKMVTAQ